MYTQGSSSELVANRVPRPCCASHGKNASGPGLIIQFRGKMLVKLTYYVYLELLDLTLPLCYFQNFHTN